MIPAFIVLLLWTGPHTPCVLARPYDGEPMLFAPDLKRKVQLLDEGRLYVTPDRQSATVCALPDGERTA